MTNYTTRTVTTKTIQVVLPLPCYSGDIKDAMGYINGQLGPDAGYDDAFTVTSDGEELIFSFRVSEDRTSPVLPSDIKRETRCFS